MVLATGTISSKILLPDTVNPFRLVATLEAVSAHGIVKDTTTNTLIGGSITTISEPDGTLTFADIPLLPQADISPNDARWRVRFKAYDPPRGVMYDLPATVEFEMIGDLTWGNLVDISGVPMTDSILTQVLAAQAAAEAAATAAQAAQTDFHLEDQGAVGDGATDDSAAINATIALMSPGDRLVPTPGKVFAHSGVIDLDVDGIEIVGGSFYGLDSAHCAMYLTGDGVRVTNTIKTVPWVARTNTQDSHSFVLRGANQVLDHCTAEGAGGVGVFVFGATDFLVDSPIVRDVGADGIHTTYGATKGLIRSPRVATTGDDHLAFVSYQGDPAPVTEVQALDVIVDCTNQTHGRGIAVVGGEDITVDGYKVIKSWGAGLYINVETAFSVRSIERIRFLHGELVEPNRGWGAPSPVNHGGILLSNQVALTLDDVEIRDLVMTDAGTSMSGVGRMVAFQNQGGGTATNLHLEGFKARGTLPASFYSDPDGVIDDSTFTDIDFGNLPTASLPAPVTFKVPAGATVYDTTLDQRAYCTGSVWAYYGAVSDPGFKVLTGNVSASDNGNYPISDLSIPVANAATYVLDGAVYYEASTAGDIKVYWLIPGGADLQWGGIGLGAAANAGSTQGDFNSLHVVGGTATAGYGGAGIGTRQHLILRGILTTFANGGTCQLGFGQQTTDGANPTVVKAKSWVRATRVA